MGPYIIEPFNMGPFDFEPSHMGPYDMWFSMRSSHTNIIPFNHSKDVIPHR